jgi:hypothetical protein
MSIIIRKIHQAVVLIRIRVFIDCRMVVRGARHESGMLQLLHERTIEPKSEIIAGTRTDTPPGIHVLFFQHKQPQWEAIPIAVIIFCPGG